MEFLVMKANNDYWYKIENYETIEELTSAIEKRHHGFIIRKNDFHGQDPLEIYKWFTYDNRTMTMETARKISTLKYQITIYNGYIE